MAVKVVSRPCLTTSPLTLFRLQHEGLSREPASVTGCSRATMEIGRASRPEFGLQCRTVSSVLRHGRLARANRTIPISDKAIKDRLARLELRRCPMHLPDRRLSCFLRIRKVVICNARPVRKNEDASRSPPRQSRNSWIAALTPSTCCQCAKWLESPISRSGAPGISSAIRSVWASSMASSYPPAAIMNGTVMLSSCSSV